MHPSAERISRLLAVCVLGFGVAVGGPVRVSAGGLRVQSVQAPVTVPRSADPVRITIGGPEIRVDTVAEQAFVFEGRAGQLVSIESDRDVAVRDPVGAEVTEDRRNVFELFDTGRYVVSVPAALRAPASLKVAEVSRTPIVQNSAVGQTISFDPTEYRHQYARIPVRGGQRYSVSAVSSGAGASFCVSSDRAPLLMLPCVPSSENHEATRTFVPTRDQVVVVWAYPAPPTSVLGLTDSISLTFSPAPNDLLAGVSGNSVVELDAKYPQAVVVPVWGSPADRVVLSSPNEANVSAWGDPWIDREETPEGRVKVFAVPTAFKPDLPPFVTWSGSATAPNHQRVGVFRGEDNAFSLPADGKPVSMTNQPWFAAVGAMSLEGGARYAIHIVGKDLRPLTAVVREPNGKFTPNISPWQWSVESNGDQHAVAVLDTNRPGRWALEVRLPGNVVRDMTVTAVKLGDGGRYESVVEVADLLHVGEATDVPLGPNEYAEFRLKLNSATPQIVQPDVKRFRNSTFQPTAADMSLWDAKGRLVWSNNRNLEEEVLSGRLGQEPQLSERFATVSGPDEYKLIVDPHTDIAGRFRVSVASTPVNADVSLGNGAIRILPGGTFTGVVEVREPTRYRIAGTGACLVSTSTAELRDGAGGAGLPCLRADTTITLPPGVHRLRFDKALTTPTSFTKVPDGAPADPVTAFSLAVDGAAANLPAGPGTVEVTFTAKVPNQRLAVFDADGSLPGTLLGPDGEIRYFYGPFVLAVPGTYVAVVNRNPSNAQRLRVGAAGQEIRSVTQAVGRTSRIYDLMPDQRLEVSVTVKTRSRYAVDFFDSGADSADLRVIADSRENRFVVDDFLDLSPGTYRFVFTGDGTFRFALRPVASKSG